MSHLFISTSRKPNPATRRLSNWLAALFNAEHHNRGKYSVEEIVDQAERAGRTRVLFVYDFKGNPGEMAAFETADTWVSPAVRITSCELPDDRPRRYAERVEFEGSDAKVFENWMGYDKAKAKKRKGDVEEDYEDLPAVTVIANNGRLSFAYDGFPVGPRMKYYLKELKRFDEDAKED